MTEPATPQLQARIEALDPSAADYVCQVVELLLADAVQRGASDIHLEPTHRCIQIRYRLDGVLHPVAALPRDRAPNLIARLKVLACLLTYRTDVPQEGRIESAAAEHGVDMRLSTFPTIHGEKAVVRIFDPTGRTMELDRLGLSNDQLDALTRLLQRRSGAILLTGPSGSGKTTTIYACLRHLVQRTGGQRHIVTIEDPVEQALEGVSQSQARPGTEFDFARGLRSLLRQDPEVIMIGEVRDRQTAAIAIEAALTGHLVISTLHAGSACGVITRLLDMGIEPYLLTSGLVAVVNQRLARRLCRQCRRATGLATAPWQAVGCPACSQTGYRGRLLLAEMLCMDEPLRRAILARSDTSRLEAVANRTGRRTIHAAAAQAVADGLTTPEEIERVMGPES